MGKHAKWAVALLLAAAMGAGIAQVSAMVSEQRQAAASVATAKAVPDVNCSGVRTAGRCSAGGCSTAKAAQPQGAGKASGCPMAEMKREAQARAAGATAASACPAKAAGKPCADCSRHDSCPDARGDKPQGG